MCVVPAGLSSAMIVDIETELLDEIDPTRSLARLIHAGNSNRSLVPGQDSRQAQAENAIGAQASFGRSAGPKARGRRAPRELSTTSGPSQTEKTLASGPNSLMTCRQAP